MKDRLNKPIEYICATYSFEGLQKLLSSLKDANNIAAVADEITMRVRSELVGEEKSLFDDWLEKDCWDYQGKKQ